MPLIRLKAVVHRQFLALLDPPESPKEYPLADVLSVQVRIAGVIDPFGTATVHGTVQCPVRIKLVGIDPPPLPGDFPVLFSIEQSPGVLNDVPPLRDVLLGDDAPPMNGGLDQPQRVVAIVRIDLRRQDAPEPC